jgi:site-specific recombinase XerD
VTLSLAIVRNDKDTVPHRFTTHSVDKRNYPPFVGHTWGRAEPLPNDEPPATAEPTRDTAAACTPESADDTSAATPNWFADFLIDRATRKPSTHTIKAYRQDFAAVANLLTAGGPAEVALTDITKDSMRAAFAAYAATHEPASIRRCWSTWNVLCDFLYTAELIAANPMPFVGRPKPAKTLPRSLPQPAVGALLDVVGHDHASTRRTDWAERDLALILTGLLAGLRADELRRADVRDIRTTDGGAVIHVRGKGGKDRAVPIEADLLSVIEDYLESRARRLPAALKASTRHGLSRWPANAPLFVGRDGGRITRGTIQSRVRRAFRRAGPDAQPVRGALVHGLRHTYATELANSDVSVYTLMKLLGHESMATSQRYVAGAARETRGAAARNPLYAFVRDRRRASNTIDRDGHL